MKQIRCTKTGALYPYNIYLAQEPDMEVYEAAPVASGPAEQVVAGDTFSIAKVEAAVEKAFLEPLTRNKGRTA
jgi:hypothetical protein